MARRNPTASPLRVCIYARMSTDKQSADSPADQIAHCREYAAREGWRVVEDLVVSETGISGSSRHNRPGLLELFNRIDEWDVLLCFDSSRLARNGEDLGWMRNRLKLRQRRAVEVSTGFDLENIGAKVMGVFNEEYVAKLKVDVRRGLRGRVDRGRAAGAMPYGYRTEPCEDGSRIVVVPEHAATVRRIFCRYAGGSGLRAIAHDLNAEGVQAPRGRGWAPSAVREMLRNPLYRGEYLWNRSEWIKDHDTGRRCRIERPESEWVRQFDESWRIVTDAQWDAVQAAIGSRSTQVAKSRAGGRAYARHALSGFLECGECGGSFHALNGRERYGCAWRRDRGGQVCNSGLLVDRGALESRIFGAIRDQILVPEHVTYVVSRAIEEIQGSRADRDTESVRHRLGQIEVELERAVDLGVRTGGLDLATRKIEALRAEQSELLEQARTEPLALPPIEDLVPVIEARVRDFRWAFDSEPETIRTALRALLGDSRFAVRADAERGFAVEGYVALPLMRQTPGVSEDTGRLQRMVAGEGFEPPTSGL